MLSLWMLQGGLCRKTSWSLSLKPHLIPSISCKTTKDSTEPTSHRWHLFKNMCKKGWKLTDTERTKRVRETRGKAKVKAGKGRTACWRRSCGRLVLSLPKLQLGISGGTAEYSGATLGHRKCEEKGKAERKHSVLTLNPTDYIPLNHLVRTMVFWSAELIISLRKGGTKGLFKCFFSLYPMKEMSIYLFN